MGIKLKSGIKIIPPVIILCSFLLSFLLSLAFPAPFERLNFSVQNLLFKVRYSLTGREQIYPYLINVGFSDVTYEKLNIHTSADFRDYSVRILEILRKEGAGPVGVDIIFADSVNQEIDNKLMEEIKTKGDLFLPFIAGNTLQTDFNNEPPFPPWFPEVTNPGNPEESNFFITSTLPFSPRGWGHINLLPESPLYRFPLVRKWRDGYVPSLALALVCYYLQVPPDGLVLNFGKEITLKEARFPGGPKKDIVIPVDNQGRMLLNYPGPWEDSFLQTSVHSLIAAPAARDFLENSIVLISDCSGRGKDFTRGIFDPNYPSAGIHLTAINMILTDNFLLPSGLFYNLAVALVCIGFLFASTLAFIKIRWELLLSGLILLLFLLFQAMMFIFSSRVSLIIEPGLGILASISGCNLYFYFHDKQTKRIVEEKFNRLADLLSEKTSGDDEALQAVHRNLKPLLDNIHALKEAREGAYQIVHELKNTSFSVSFILEQLIKKINSDSKTINRLSMITREMSRLYDFSTKHLDYALMSKKGSMDHETLDPAPLIEEAVIRGREKGEQKAVSLELFLEQDITITGDKSALPLLFYNLIENAVKYSPAGSQVQVSGKKEDNWFCFRVRDWGPGFGAAEIMTEKKKGFTSHGLGLKLCRLITEKHKGLLETTDREDGAEVTLRLPLPSHA